MRVLVVAYFFPPDGGAGVARWFRMTTHLLDLGVTPVVLTGSGDMAGEMRPADRVEPPDGVEVHRVPGPEPRPTTGGIRSWARRKDAWTGWWERGIAQQGAALAADCDAIVATMSPFQTAEPVRRLATSLGLPWVADLRDPWAIDEVRTFHSRAHRALEVKHMGSLLRAADAVVMNTQESRRRVLESGLGLCADHVHVITNGAYPAAAPAGGSGSRDGPFTIVHTGMFHTAEGLRLRRRSLRHRALGGIDPGLDLLSRSHVFLLEALRRVASPVRLDLIGQLSAADRAASDRYGSTVDVRYLGYLPRTESRAHVEAADMLFLPMHGTGGRRATIVPEKTYEYLASGRPMLAAVPPGDARDLLTGSDRVYVSEPTDVLAMAAAIRREISLRKAGAPAPTRNPAILAPFDPTQLARSMADVLRGVVGKGRGRSGGTVGRREGHA